MTKPFKQTLNEIHRTLWEKSDDGKISGEEIKNQIKLQAGYTVVEKFWNELHNFNKIEQVPDTETWIVTKPEKTKIDKDKRNGNKKAKQVKVPEEILEAGKNYGLNFSQLLTQAIIDKIADKKEFVKDYLGEDYSQEESEYIFELLKQDLDKKKGRQKKQAQRGRRRREIYKETFDVVKADRQHISSLRKQSAKLSEML